METGTAPAVFSPGNTILISGAASGIGLAVASLCYTKHGMNLILVDNNSKLLSQAATGFASSSGHQRVTTHVMDVSSLSDWTDLKRSIASILPNGRLDALMLNAGIGTKGDWTDPGYFNSIMSVNLFGQINGLNTFYDMLYRPRGQTSTPAAIIMTGSKQGITNPPGNAAYNASKSAVKTLAEHLSYDLRDTLTTVTLLVPGWTFTGLTGGGGLTEKPEGAWSASQVAERLEQAVLARKFWCICPDNQVTEEMDQRRMMWTAGDAVFGRPPLSRWRDETKDEAADWMKERRF